MKAIRVTGKEVTVIDGIETMTYGICQVIPEWAEPHDSDIPKILADFSIMAKHMTLEYPSLRLSKSLIYMEKMTSFISL